MGPRPSLGTPGRLQQVAKHGSLLSSRCSPGGLPGGGQQRLEQGQVCSRLVPGSRATLGDTVEEATPSPWAARELTDGP